MKNPFITKKAKPKKNDGRAKNGNHPNTKKNHWKPGQSLKSILI